MKQLDLRDADNQGSGAAGGDAQKDAELQRLTEDNQRMFDDNSRLVADNKKMFADCNTSTKKPLTFMSLCNILRSCKALRPLTI